MQKELSCKGAIDDRLVFGWKQILSQRRAE